MTTKPILFSTSMVQAILEDRKTQTRRIIKPQPDPGSSSKIIRAMVLDGSKKLSGLYRNPDGKITSVFPKYQVGDIMWVRENFYKTTAPELKGAYYYKASIDEGWNMKWKPSIYMPKAACRIFLEDTNVRVERLQDISEEDAIAEGVLSAECKDNSSCPSSLCRNGCVSKGDYHKYPIGDHFEDFAAASAIESFESLWESINGKESWDANPWVWVYDFKRVEKPENF